jgi:choice-of-anchor C domain-containing protein
MKILGLVAGAAMLVMGAQGASAVTIVNGNFETPTPSNPFDYRAAGSNELPGWTIGGNGIDHIGNGWQAQSGGASIDLSGNGGSGHGSISQFLTGFVTGQEYTVSFYMSGNTGSGTDTKSLDLGLFDDAALTSLLDSENYIYNTATQGNTTTDMKWALYTFKFIAQQSAYYLAFADASASASNSGAALDNVTIAATPIPGALLLFGSALGGMGFLGYRRKKQAAEA